MWWDKVALEVLAGSGMVGIFLSQVCATLIKFEEMVRAWRDLRRSVTGQDNSDGSR